MKLIERAPLAGKLRRLESRPGVRQEGPVGEADPEGRAHFADVLHHARDVRRAVKLGQGPSFRRCLGMDLNAGPFHREIELLLQLFDDALADVAEGSDVVGKDLHADGHGLPSDALASSGRRRSVSREGSRSVRGIMIIIYSIQSLL